MLVQPSPHFERVRSLLLWRGANFDIARAAQPSRHFVLERSRIGTLCGQIGVPLLPTLVSYPPHCLFSLAGTIFWHVYTDYTCALHGGKIHWQEKTWTEEVCLGHYVVSPSCLSGKHGYLALAPLRGGNADRALSGLVAVKV